MLRIARFVSDLGQEVVEWLAPQPGERILDLGCGDGALTARIAESGAEVVGVDSSAELAAAARRRGLDVRVADARDLPFEAEFDAVFSNAALHWIPEADVAVDNVRRALKPGGRFVAEMGGHGNIAAIQTALIAVLLQRGIDGAARSPWYFPSASSYHNLLKRSGFRVERIELFARPTRLPIGGMDGWLRTFANPFLAGFEGEELEQLLKEVTDLCLFQIWSG